MEKIKILRAEIGELASALERMNDNATPETALTIKVANEIFGKTLADKQAELAQLEVNSII
tara:strand:+ start:340 stop:522 length:183 start_codon:yes stop_codon:yes gene_type:complete